MLTAQVTPTIQPKGLRPTVPASTANSSTWAISADTGPLGTVRIARPCQDGSVIEGTGAEAPLDTDPAGAEQARLPIPIMTLAPGQAFPLRADILRGQQ